MTVPASHQDLLDNPNIAVLTTIDENGQPQSTAVWYLVDEDGYLNVSFADHSVKARNLRGNPNANLFIFDPQNPFRTLELRLHGSVANDPEKASVPVFASRYGVPDEFLLSLPGERAVATFEIQKAVAFSGV